MLLSFFGRIQFRGFQRLVTQQHFHLHSATWMSLAFGSWKSCKYFSNAPFPQNKTSQHWVTMLNNILSCKYKKYTREFWPVLVVSKHSQVDVDRFVLSDSALRYCHTHACSISKCFTGITSSPYRSLQAIELVEKQCSRSERQPIRGSGSGAPSGVQGHQRGPRAEPLVRGQGRSFSAFEHHRRSQIWLFLCIFHVFYIRSIFVLYI